MAPSQEDDGLASLQDTISNLTTLIHKFQTTLQLPPVPQPTIPNPPNPLALLSDASQILKAQTTKLSLLILNKPFTPSAITFVLNSISTGALPALMSALKFCPADKYTHVLQHYVQRSLSRILMEVLSLLRSIPTDDYGIQKSLGRDTLASTGVLWAECDKMVEISSSGLVKLAAQKVIESHGLVKDAIAELEDWDPNAETDSDTDSSLSNGLNHLSFSDPAYPPGAPSQGASSLLALRQRVLATLRTIRIVYPALQKRRISTFPNITSITSLKNLPTPSQIESLDRLLSCTQQWTEATDEIAGALYENDEVKVENLLKELKENLKNCLLSLKNIWTGNEDEFTTWVGKFVDRLEEVGCH